MYSYMVFKNMHASTKPNNNYVASRVQKDYWVQDKIVKICS